MGRSYGNQDTVWVEIQDIVQYTDDSILIQPAESPDDEIWIPRDMILDHSPGDVELQDAEEIELPEDFAYQKGL